MGDRIRVLRSMSHGYGTTVFFRVYVPNLRRYKSRRKKFDAAVSKFRSEIEALKGKVDSINDL